jgi:CBS domain-containing protein
MAVRVALGVPMKIRDVLQAKGAAVEVIGPDAPLGEVVTRLAEHRIGALVVTDDAGGVTGIVSERDVVRSLADEGPDALDHPVRGVMSTPVTTCSADDDVVLLMSIMTDRRIRHVPVVDDGRLQGIVSIGDVVKSRVDQLEQDRKELLEYVSAR